MKKWEYIIGRRVYDEENKSWLIIFGLKVLYSVPDMFEVAGEFGWELTGVVNMMAPNKSRELQEKYPTTYFFFKRPKEKYRRER